MGQGEFAIAQFAEIPHIAQAGTIIEFLSSADNSFLVHITAPTPLGILALSRSLNVVVNSIDGEAVFFISMG